MPKAKKKEAAEVVEEIRKHVKTLPKKEQEKFVDDLLFEIDLLSDEVGVGFEDESE